MAQSMGPQARLAFDTVTPFDGSSYWLDFTSENLGKKSQILPNNAVTGGRSHRSERTRAGKEDIGGHVTFFLSPHNFNFFLPHILGTAEAADLFEVAETLIPLAGLKDSVDDGYLYEDLYVNTCTIRGSMGSGLIECTLNLIGKTRTAGQTWPAALTSAGLPIGTNTAPYVFTDGVLTLQAGAREFSDFELVIDNALNVDHRNSITATDIDPGDRIVTLNAVVPAVSGNAALIDQALAGATGTLVLTNGAFSTTFTFATLQSPMEDPMVGGKGPIQYNLSMTARQLSTTKEIVVNNVLA